LGGLGEGFGGPELLKVAQAAGEFAAEAELHGVEECERAGLVERGAGGEADEVGVGDVADEVLSCFVFDGGDLERDFVFLENLHAFAAPVGVGHGFDDCFLRGPLGIKGCAEALANPVEHGGIFAVEQDGIRLRVASVNETVEAGLLFSFCCDGAV
jgi:hypothetical protein